MPQPKCPRRTESYHDTLYVAYIKDFSHNPTKGARHIRYNSTYEFSVSLFFLPFPQQFLAQFDLNHVLRNSEAQK
jgi:hypothetical protein